MIPGRTRASWESHQGAFQQNVILTTLSMLKARQDYRRRNSAGNTTLASGCMGFIARSAVAPLLPFRKIPDEDACGLGAVGGERA